MRVSDRAGTQRIAKIHRRITAWLSLTKTGKQKEEDSFTDTNEGDTLEHIIRLKEHREKEMKEEMKYERKSKQPPNGVTTRRGLFSPWLFLFIALSLAPEDVTCRKSLNAGE